MMTRNQNTSLSVTPVKQAEPVTTKLSNAVRIQSLDQLQFLSKDTALNPLQNRIKNDMLTQKEKAQVLMNLFESSLLVQETALTQLKALYNELDDSTQKQKLWDGWLHYIQNVIKSENTVYTQDFMTKAMGESEETQQYLPLAYTNPPMPNQEQLRQMLGYWFEQESFLKASFKQAKTHYQTSLITLENIEASTPAVDPSTLIG